MPCYFQQMKCMYIRDFTTLPLLVLTVFMELRLRKEKKYQYVN